MKYTNTEILQLGPLVDGAFGLEGYASLLRELIYNEPTQEDVLRTFLAGYVGGVTGDEAIKLVYETPLDEMPIHMTDTSSISTKIIAQWRLKLCK